jgi:hypothetical protein
MLNFKDTNVSHWERNKLATIKLNTSTVKRVLNSLGNLPPDINQIILMYLVTNAYMYTMQKLIRDTRLTRQARLLIALRYPKGIICIGESVCNVPYYPFSPKCAYVIYIDDNQTRKIQKFITKGRFIPTENLPKCIESGYVLCPKYPNTLNDVWGTLPNLLCLGVNSFNWYGLIPIETIYTP